jgi:hypothetical protein
MTVFRSTRRAVLPPALFALGVAILAVACAGDPVARLEARRARYTATVQSFVVKDEGAAAAQPQILLDLLIQHDDAGEPLPGITLDVSMADSSGNEKAHRRIWVDTTRVGPGGAQTSIQFDDLPYQPGDGFFVEVRSPVPAAERGEYKEFSGLS